MSLPQDVSTRVNNVHFRQPVDRRFSMYNSMDSFHRKNRGFPSRQQARAALAPKQDPVKTTPFRYRLLPPDYRPLPPDYRAPNPIPTHTWRRSNDDPSTDPLPSVARRFSHAPTTSTEEVPYGTMRRAVIPNRRNRRGKKTTETSRKSSEILVLPKIKTRGIVCGSETDNPTLSLDVLTVSRPAAMPRRSGSITSSERRSNACADRLPPLSTRSDVSQYAEQSSDQWMEYLTLLRQRIMDRHYNQSRKDADAINAPAWTTELLSVSAFIDTDSYNLYARTAPTDKQHRGCIDKPWNFNT